MIEVRCFESLTEAEFLRDEVNELNRRSARPDPFSSFEFFETFFRHEELFAQEGRLKLWFLTASSAGRLIGYLALQRVTRKVMGIRISMLGFLVTHDTDRPHLVAQTESVAAVSEAFYAYLLGRRAEWSFLEFLQQDDSSPLFPPPAATDLHGYVVRQWPSLANGTIRVRWGTLAAYSGSLSKKFRGNVHRQMRNLLAAGEVQFLSSEDAGSTPALLELYMIVERRSWKARADATIGPHPQRVGYILSLLDAKQPMRVSIHILLLDGIPVAGLITGAYLTGLYALHTVYDDRYSRLAPGAAMLLMGVRQAIEGQYAFFNLLSGFAYFKARWLAEITETRIAQIYRAGGVMSWHRWLGDCKRRILSDGSPGRFALFNVVRRTLMGSKTGPATTTEAEISPPDLDERARVAMLVAVVRRGRCEFLSATGLVAAMPFGSPPAADLAPARAAGSQAIAPVGAVPRPDQAAAATGRAVTRNDSMSVPIALIDSPMSMPMSAPGTPKRRIAR
jgi:hypothetical protein